MLIPVTVDEELERAKVIENPHRTLNEKLSIINNDGSTIICPLNPLVSKYKDFLEKYIKTDQLTDEQYYRYRYAPKTFSLDKYNTTGYWSMILFLNECHTMADFDLNSIRYVDPYVLPTIVDEILTLEGSRNEK